MTVRVTMHATMRSGGAGRAPLPGRLRPRRRMAADLRHSMKRVERTLFWVFWGVVLAVVLLIVVA